MNDAFNHIRHTASNKVIDILKVIINKLMYYWVLLEKNIITSFESLERIDWKTVINDILSQ